ncbi:hypothetical protein [Clostridium sp. B9]|uniref:hypothetical protein n=1 Tax=Clostridium sp. B9 TaxID=3423224 RepID=UPI003D2E9F4A
MGSNHRKNFNDDCFRDLKNDFNRLIRNFKRNCCKGRRVPRKRCPNDNIKWFVVGGILSLLVISQIGIPIAFFAVVIILIAMLWNRW